MIFPRDWSNHVYAPLLLFENMETTIVDVFDQQLPSLTETPVKYVIIILTSPDQLTNTLQNTTWQHPYQFYILIEHNQNQQNCNNAKLYLIEAWKNDLLNSIFICFVNKQNHVMYSFNPYINEAPNPWEHVSRISSPINYHPWTLFKRLYNSGNLISFSVIMWPRK